MNDCHVPEILLSDSDALDDVVMTEMPPSHEVQGTSLRLIVFVSSFLIGSEVVLSIGPLADQTCFEPLWPLYKLPQGMVGTVTGYFATGMAMCVVWTAEYRWALHLL